MERIKKTKLLFSNFGYIQTTVRKKNKIKIQITIARKIPVAVWHMHSKEEDLIDIYIKRFGIELEMEEKLKVLLS